MSYHHGEGLKRVQTRMSLPYAGTKPQMHRISYRKKNCPLDDYFAPRLSPINVDRAKQTNGKHFDRGEIGSARSFLKPVHQDQGNVSEEAPPTSKLGAIYTISLAWTAYSLQLQADGLQESPLTTMPAGSVARRLIDASQPRSSEAGPQNG